jgi:hypothetical protein
MYPIKLAMLTWFFWKVCSRPTLEPCHEVVPINPTGLGCRSPA